MTTQATTPPRRGAARLAAVIAARRAGQTLKEIGRAHGISRERVRQLLARASARLGSPISAACSDCGAPIRRSTSRRVVCRACAARRARARTCRRCGAAFTRDGAAYAYCPACRTETRPCAACGRPVTRDRGRDQSSFRNQMWFCDRVCFGQWAGRRYGFPPAEPGSALCPGCRTGVRLPPAT
jgi:hypothetical protein